MWEKIKAFFIRIKPSKRKIIQVYAALLHNAYMMGFVTGEIFKGGSKIVCAPGLNCYSCPGAVGACPLGTIQNALYESKTKTPTYVLGIILLYCIILGRTICGWLCPLGLVQELLYKIKTPKLQKSRVTRVLSYFKYILLVVLVVAIPLMFSSKNIAVPGFCKYICPAGTLGGAISILINPANADKFGYLGPIFTWKFLVLVIFIVASIFIFRFFCRFLCPLGAIYGIFNKLSILGIKVDKTKCDNCGACVRHCKMDVKEVGDHECIMCGECKDVCHVNAIHWKTIGKLVEKDLLDEGFVAATDLGSVELKHSKSDDLQKIEMSNALAHDTNAQEDENIIVLDEEKKPRPKKKFRLTEMHQKIFKITCYVLMAASLIFTFIYANFMVKSVLEVNDAAKDVIVTLSESYEGSDTFFVRKDEGATILYFYDEFNKDDILTLNSFITSPDLADAAKGKIKILAISRYENRVANYESMKALELDSNVLFGYDDENDKLLSDFVFKENMKFPYIVSLDPADKVVLKEDKMITDREFDGIIVPGAIGDVVGNKVGNKVIAADINLIGSDEVFNVLNNKGKITVLNFWYTTCTPCVQELPHFDEVQKMYPDMVDIIAIHEGDIYLEDPDDVKSFIDTKFSGYSIKFAHDSAGSKYYEALGGTGAYPMTIIVDQNGYISFVGMQKVEKDDLLKEITKLLPAE